MRLRCNKSIYSLTQATDNNKVDAKKQRHLLLRYIEVSTDEELVNLTITAINPVGFCIEAIVIPGVKVNSSIRDTVAKEMTSIDKTNHNNGKQRRTGKLL